jgi:hypothetical protein
MESDGPFGLRYSESMNATVIDMATPLDPLISEFDTAEEAEAYDLWFRAEVQASIDDPRPSIPHDQVMAEMHELIEAKRKARRAG